MIDGRFLAICDCNFSAASGQWEVVDQRDWTVPEFTLHDFTQICNNADCKGGPDNRTVCETCVVTRLKEAVFEEQY